MRSAEPWAPKLGDHVKVVSLAPLEATNCWQARENKSPFIMVAKLHLGDTGRVVLAPLGNELLFEVRFDRIGQTVVCNTEMVQPYDVVVLALLPNADSATVYDHTGEVSWQTNKYSKDISILRNLADHLGWQSNGYIDAEHKFPVTEVWQ